MRSILLFVMGLSCSLFFTCKKVKKKVDAEKPFVLFFRDTSGMFRNECFDYISAWNKPPIHPPCTQYYQGIKLPLNMMSDSSRFFFVKGNRRDTLTIYYKHRIGAGDNEFEVFYTVNRISTSFDSLSRACVPELNPNCHGNEAVLYATVYTY